MSPHDDVEHHHQDKANGKADGAEVAVLTGRGFRYQFLHHDIQHGAGGKGRVIGQTKSKSLRQRPALLAAVSTPGVCTRRRSFLALPKKETWR